MISIEQPKLGPAISKLDSTEIAVLRIFCEAKYKRFPVLCGAILQILADEEAMRESGNQRGQHALPLFHGDQAGQALMASFVFSRFPFNQGVSLFLEDVAQHVLANVVAILNAVEVENEVCREAQA